MARSLPSKPGWYPNPQGDGSLQFWDGTLWTGRYRPRPAWLVQATDLEPVADFTDRSQEGPAQPRRLREPVASAASGRDGPGSWRSWQAQRSWHRPTVASSEGQGPTVLMPAAKFASARRPLMIFTVLVVVAVAVVISSVAVMTPYQQRGGSNFAASGSNATFLAAASRECSATLPKYRAALLTSFDGPSITAASRQVDSLRYRLESLSPAPGIEAPVEAWLNDWAQVTAMQRRYAAIVGAAQHRDGRLVPRPLGDHAQVAAATERRKAFSEAAQADHFTSNLRIQACRLEPGSPA